MATTLTRPRQLDLREQNEFAIVQAIRRSPGVTQSAVADEIGITRAAVSKLISGREHASTHRTGLGFALRTEGSRPLRYSVRDGLGHVLSLELGSRHIRLLCKDLNGATVAALPDPDEAHPDPRLIEDPQLALDTAAAMVRQMVDDLAARPRPIYLTPSRVAGMSIGVPFPVTRDGKPHAPRRAWRFTQLPGALWDRLEDWRLVPTAVRSDVTLGAWAEMEAALDADSGLPDISRRAISMVYVKWSAQVSGAVISGGRLQRGRNGLAGQFAHTALPTITGNPADLKECERCGHRCLDANASISAIRTDLGIDDALDSEQAAAELIRRLDGDQDRAAQNTLRRAAFQLGLALGSVINTLDPDLLIIGGAFKTDAYNRLAPWVQEGLAETTYAPILERVIVQGGRRTGHAAALGGALLALDRFAARYLIENRELLAAR